MLNTVFTLLTAIIIEGILKILACLVHTIQWNVCIPLQIGKTCVPFPLLCLQSASFACPLSSAELS